MTLQTFDEYRASFTPMTLEQAAEKIGVEPDDLEGFAAVHVHEGGDYFQERADGTFQTFVMQDEYESAEKRRVLQFLYTEFYVSECFHGEFTEAELTDLLGVFCDLWGLPERSADELQYDLAGPEKTPREFAKYTWLTWFIEKWEQHVESAA